MKQLQTVKILFNTHIKTKLIVFLVVAIFILAILYFIPHLFISLFATMFGNLILCAIALLALTYNVKYGIITSLILIIIYRSYQLSSSVEGFGWNAKSTQDFLLIQNTINRQKVFDVNMIQQNQASQSEVDYFNSNGIWPWSEETKALYVNATNNNPYIRTYPKDALHTSMTIYNEAAILRILSYQTKEGQFLLSGIQIKDPSGNKLEELPNGLGGFAYNSGLTENNTNDIIRCNMDGDNATLERITYTGKGSVYGEQTQKTTPVDYTNLEKIIAGFTFINSPCNPCGALNENPDYSCPFKLNVKNKHSFISNVWQYLWNQ